MNHHLSCPHSVPAGVNIFAHAKLFFPIVTEGHWSLVVASMQTLRGGPGSGSLEYFDSSADRIPLLQVSSGKIAFYLFVISFTFKRQNLLEKVKGWIEGDAGRMSRPFDGPKWSTSITVVPEQLDECDSGVMMLVFVDMARKLLSVEFDASYVDHLRYNFAVEIISSADND